MKNKIYQINRKATRLNYYINNCNPTPERLYDELDDINQMIIELMARLSTYLPPDYRNK